MKNYFAIIDNHFFVYPSLEETFEQFKLRVEAEYCEEDVRFSQTVLRVSRRLPKQKNTEFIYIVFFAFSNVTPEHVAKLLIKNKIMNPNNIKSGWWVATDERFVTCYNTKEEALAHIKYQKEHMLSTKPWYIYRIEVKLKIHSLSL